MTTIIIVAGGSGQRMNAQIPKQFILLDNKPILMRTMEKFFHYDKSFVFILALPKSQIEVWKALCQTYNFQIKHQIVEGGKTRFESVKNAIAQSTSQGLIGIHDGVRPFVSNSTISHCIISAKKLGSGIPAVKIVDSLRKIDKNKHFPVDRELFRSIQTPQFFTASKIKAAYKQNYCAEFTDDASVYEKFGETVYLVEGNRENIKITTQTDLILAEALLKTEIKGC
ncbi:MAG: 2-C-methyl-D-erythritol 4-phosphate cytidylyltransferase [Bacteroidia bacterium]|nr:MAG: 2-C-methyl-D-erythritol 4-phosphate cytidylyltransferase [Bacteroidia bacterium]PIE86450.1 MAG: 2-C-methyl-D-erythritol 4-phosphate cytidylyltransferase [Bacteroidia bacterium]